MNLINLKTLFLREIAIKVDYNYHLKNKMLKHFITIPIKYELLRYKVRVLQQ